MALVVCDGGELIALKALVNNAAQSTNLTLKLYKSDTTPGNTDTAATYTEADFTGYSAATLTGSSWVVTGNPVTYAKQTFTSSAGSQNQNVYGYYIVAGAATAGLILFGAVGAWLGGASKFKGAMRVLVGGWVAMVITYGIGRFFGVSTA